MAEANGQKPVAQYMYVDVSDFVKVDEYKE